MWSRVLISSLTSQLSSSPFGCTVSRFVRPRVLIWDWKLWLASVLPLHGRRVLLLWGSYWGCFGQSVVLGDHPLAQAWLLSVKSLFMFCSSHFSKFYSCFKVPLKPFPVIPASCDHAFLRFLSLLGTWRIFLFIQSLVNTHFPYGMYFLFSRCGVFLAQSL